MRAIIIVMLCVQAGLIVVTALTILMAKPQPGRSRPVWSSLAISLVIGAGTSVQIADRHDLSAGARLLEYGSGLLLGMGLVCILFLMRQRLGRDAMP
jgi:hypothetical protein